MPSSWLSAWTTCLVRSIDRATVRLCTCTFLTLRKKASSRSTPAGVDISAAWSLTVPDT